MAVTAVMAGPVAVVDAEMVMIFAAGGVVRDGRGTSEWVNGVCPHARYYRVLARGTGGGPEMPQDCTPWNRQHVQSVAAAHGVHLPPEVTKER